jgi:hypothetical protein
MTDQPFMGPVVRRTAQPHCMNWEPYTLRQIWQMLEAETGQTSWAQVTAWGRMKNLCEGQAHQLRQALDELALLWPPEKSEASRVYRDVVLSMARSLDDSANAAHINAIALSNLTSGISATRQKIAHLVEQLNARDAEQAERERNRLPFWPDSGLIDTQRSELDRAARQIMHEADTIPATATAEFQIPGPYSAPTYSEDRTPIDPDQPAVTSSTPGIVGYQIPTTRVPPPIIDAPAATTTGVDPTTGLDRSFAVPRLAGAQAADDAAQPPTSTAAALSSAPTLMAGPAVSGSPASAFAVTRIPTGVGPDGIIRAPLVPSTGSDSADSPRAGSGPTAARTSGHPGMMAPMAHPGGRAASGSGHTIQAARNRRPRDPESWLVASGQPAVIEPRDEPAFHDPGPGVIGIDR